MPEIFQQYSKNYEGASNLLAKKCRSTIKLAWETYMRIVDSDTIAVRYFDTDIILYHSDNTITLNVDTWFTKTTKDRLNLLTPFNIYSDRNVWYVGESNPVEFVNGMRLTDDGDIVYIPENAVVDLKAIRRYAQNFYDAIVAGDVPVPSAGDCWYCSLRTDDDMTMGDVTKDHSHLFSHVEESYFVPSLAINATGTQLRYTNDNGTLKFWWPSSSTEQRFKRLMTAYIYNRLRA